MDMNSDNTAIDDETSTLIETIDTVSSQDGLIIIINIPISR